MAWRRHLREDHSVDRTNGVGAGGRGRRRGTWVWSKGSDHFPGITIQPYLRAEFLAESFAWLPAPPSKSAAGQLRATAATRRLACELVNGSGTAPRLSQRVGMSCETRTWVLRAGPLGYLLTP